jgi:hypothetical protein
MHMGVDEMIDIRELQFAQDKLMQAQAVLEKSGEMEAAALNAATIRYVAARLRAMILRRAANDE